MPVRYYICPLVPHPTMPDCRRPKVHNYPTIRTSVAYSINKNWCLVFVEANDFTEIDKDKDCEDVLEKVLDNSTAKTRKEVGDELKLKSLKDVSSSDQKKIKDKLTAKGISTAAITQDTALFDVVRMIHADLEQGGPLEEFG